MAMSLNELTNSLRMEEFAGRTDEQLQQEAEQRIGESYGVMREAATQRQAAIDEAYARELSSLANTLSEGQQAVAQQAARSNAAIDDYVYGRSMQRTSYGANSKGSIGTNLAKAAQVLQRQYDTASSGVENSRILLAEQLAGTLAQYDKDFLTDVQAYIDAQKQIDYDRKVAADAEYNALQMQLFELGKAGSRSGGGGYRRSSGSSPSPTSSSLYDNLSSRQVMTTYSLNTSFGTANQTTQKNTSSVSSKVASAAASKISSALTKASNAVNLAKAKAKASASSKK